ncbi:glycosyl hydrolase family 8 [Cytophagaceae bacterium ABcell3]|nr:glycosyl hydrolase family 8 [Cytophagaceae bacterium ABcell3]
MRRIFTGCFMALFIVVSAAVNLKAQTAEHPFAQNRTFSHGFMPTTISESHAQTGYEEFMDRYYRECSGDNSARIIEPSRNDRTVSEGMGYGMLLAAYYGDKEKFDKLWRFYRNRRNDNGVMHWEYTNCTNLVGRNGATDGDLDAAMALVIATCQWPNSSQPFDYEQDATNLIAAIRQHEFTTCNGLIVQKPGDAFGGCTCTNPSYFSPGYYRAFAQFSPNDADFWTKAADDSYVTLLANANSNTGLVSAWTNATGGAPSDCGVAEGGGGDADTYQYDAARTPWRIAVDYLWWGTPEAGEWLQKLTSWVNAPASDQGGWTGGGGIANITSGYHRDGRPLNTWRNSAFTGAFALAAMATSQEDADSFHDWWMRNSVTSGTPGPGQLDDVPYYQHSLKVLYMFLSTGNFWFPCSEGPTCQVPDLGEDVSLCGTSSVTLRSGVETGGDVRFTWRRGNTVLVQSSATENTFSASEPGTYSVTVEDGNCSETDEIEVASELIAPSFGGEKELCDPAVIDLTPQNLSTFPEGTTWEWQKDGSVIAGETASVLENVRRAGTYTLTASVAGCPSTSGSVEVVSNLPTPVDGCRSTPGAVQLSVEGGNGPFSWYANSSGGEALGTGETFTTPSISSNTTYYVGQGGVSVTGSVGPESRSSSGWNGAISDYDSYRIVFNAETAFTLHSVVAYPMSNQDITVRVLDSNGDIIASKTLENVSGGDAQTLDLEFSIPEGDGYTLDAYGTTGQLWMDGDGAGRSYPYTLDGVVSIVGTQPGFAAGNGWWLYFFDWTVSTGTGCARVPVEARVDQDCEDACEEPGDAGDIEGEREVCSSESNVSFSVPEVSGATEYIWTVPNGATIVEGENTRSIVVDFGTNGGTISVVPTNECGEGAMASITVDVNTAPARPGTITGSSEVCEGETEVRYSVASVSGADSYEWELPADASFSSGQNSREIYVNFGNTGGQLFVKAVNECGESRTRSITVNTVDGPATPDAGSEQFVASESATLAATSDYSGVWSNVSGSGNISNPNSSTTTVSGLSEGANVFRFTVSTTCGEAYDEVVINVGSAPEVGSIDGPDAVEAGVSYTYSVANVSGASYEWSVPSGAIIESGQGTNTINVRFSDGTSGSVRVEASNEFGTTTETLPVSVGGAPAIGSEVEGQNYVIVGETYEFSVPDVEGTDYDWSLPPGATLVGGQGTSSISVVFDEGVSGEVSVVASNANGSSTATTTVTSGYSPTDADIDGESDVEANNTYTYTVPQQEGVDYNWSVPAGVDIVSGQGTNSLTVQVGDNVSGDIAVDMSNNFGNTHASLHVNTSEPEPEEPSEIEGVDELEVGEEYTFSVPYNEGSDYEWTVPEGIEIVSGQGTNEITVVVRGEVDGEITVRETRGTQSSTVSISITAINTTSVSEATGRDNINIYPNPYTETAILRINTDTQDQVNVLITDAKGTVVARVEGQFTNEDIIVGNGLASGMYFVQVSYAGNVQVVKMIKF